MSDLVRSSQEQEEVLDRPLSSQQEEEEIESSQRGGRRKRKRDEVDELDEHEGYERNLQFVGDRVQRRDDDVIFEPLPSEYQSSSQPFSDLFEEAPSQPPSPGLSGFDFYEPEQMTIDDIKDEIPKVKDLITVIKKDIKTLEDKIKKEKDEDNKSELQTSIEIAKMRLSNRKERLTKLQTEQTARKKKK
jgi:hypothetical protein